MLDQPRAADYTIWAVAALLYVCDAARLLSPRDVLLVEAGHRRFTAAFSGAPYTLAGRVLTFAPLLLPYRGVFVAPWGRAWTDRATLEAMLESLRELSRQLLVPRLLAAWSFALLFVVGPGLTLALGVNAAVAYTGVVLYLTVLAAIACLWWRRRDFRLTAGTMALISAEVLVCPAFLPNLVRKITAPTIVDVDAAQMLLATAAPDVTDEFLARLEVRMEELIGAIGPDAPAEAQLRAYLAAVRGAR